MLTSFLVLGLLMGMRHALEADHVAAVASLATRARSTAEGVRMAALWGCGHAGALIAFGGLVALFGASLPDGVARVLEGAAGLVLAGLGIDVLVRARRRRLHFHAHEHDGGLRHLHAHVHEGEPLAAHDASEHDHAHPTRGLGRALMVGGVHGLAGSGALVVLALQSATSGAGALAYVLVFGLGSVLGMVVFSLAITVPLRLQARHLAWATRGVETALGAASIGLGAWIVLRSGWPGVH